MSRTTASSLLALAVAATSFLPFARAESTSPDSLAAVTADAQAPTLTLDASSAPAPKDFELVRTPEEKNALPLPVHTIEGVGGLAITPIAYLVNAGPKNAALSYPTASFSYLEMGSKDLEAIGLTETLFGRVELGFSADRLGTGSLRKVIKAATTVDINRDDVYLYNFNARALVIEENSFGLPLPAVTLGIQYKYNADIARINDDLGGALKGLGYHRSSGEDFTLTASKMFPKVFGRPLILTAGLRETQAATLGYLGFGKDWSATAEANIVYVPTSWLALGYEYRQTDYPYQQLRGVLNTASDWHNFEAAWIINKHETLALGWAVLGNIANSQADQTIWLQFKYEF